MIRISGKNLIAAVFLTGLALGLFFLWVSLPVYAEENLRSILQEISQRLDDLAALNADSDLNASEKRVREFQIRKEALTKIFELTLLENKDLLEKLNNLQNLDSRSLAIRNYLLKSISENDSIYQQLEERLGKTGTLKDIKTLAKDFQQWRRLVYAPKVEKIVIFSLIFREKNILETAERRLAKIESDINRLNESRSPYLRPAQSLLKTAKNHLASAELAQNRAAALVINALYKESQEPTDVLLPKELKIAPIKALIENSLDYIRMAYRIFIELGKILG